MPLRRPERREIAVFRRDDRLPKEKRVANFKIPERLEILDELPLVAGSYKVDKRTLEQRILPKPAEKKS